ncbi:hypothetical protein LSM04_006839 [Trypanosoma melophagium]|uniref:uncharacterized protein n=1 Tax=Trypanosoma melophagium TaxID=715481 RepID=UPI003519E4B6|nr:hypothetical protein LSM04_006839 [Trypanosoma melophagium]
MEEKESFSQQEDTGGFVVDAISSLLQPASSTAEVMQRALLQQQLLYMDIESLNNELKEAQGRLSTVNDTQRRELDICCTRVARCRSDVTVLFRRLNTIKQRLLRVKEALIKEKEQQLLQNEAHKETLTSCEIQTEINDTTAAAVSSPVTVSKEEKEKKSSTDDDVQMNAIIEKGKNGNEEEEKAEKNSAEGKPIEEEVVPEE